MMSVVELGLLKDTDTCFSYVITNKYGTKGGYVDQNMKILIM